MHAHEAIQVDTTSLEELGVKAAEDRSKLDADTLGNTEESLNTSGDDLEVGHEWAERATSLPCDDEQHGLDLLQ